MDIGVPHSNRLIAPMNIAFVVAHLNHHIRAAGAGARPKGRNTVRTSGPADYNVERFGKGRAHGAFAGLMGRAER
jgi:hypothetical protein